MMTDPLPALVTFAVVATASPGGATSLATASGARFGLLRSLPLILGIATALALLVAASGTGLAATILAFPFLQFAMKVAGSVYLLWLALVILRAGPPAGTNVTEAAPIGFCGGAMLLAVNPKAWAMAVGVASSFSGISDDPVALAATFGLVFAASATISLSLWAATGSFLATVMHKDWQWHLFNLVMALLLVGSIASFWL